MFRSAYRDTFARDNLPPPSAWPDLLFTLPELDYPERLNAVPHLLDRWVDSGHGNRPCLIAAGETLTYAEAAAKVNRLANVLTRDLGMIPGNRVLLRAPNSPMLAIAHLAVMKAGGIVVASMPLLRAGELVHPIQKAEIKLALCDQRLGDELEKARSLTPQLERVVYWGGGGPDSLEALMAQPGYEVFSACDTASDDVCLIGFTSGTTGVPKGTVHFHRDLLATCDTYGKHVLCATAEDRFIGSPPLAFTFGLGGLVLFPLRAGAATILIKKAGPEDLLGAIMAFRATVCFTAPTAYRVMLGKLAGYDISSLRKCISAGETLPKATFEAWRAATQITPQDGLGSTEMLHIFICCREAEMRAGCTGKPVPGYEARIIDAEGRPLPPGTPGLLAVRGPTGCRYLADERQRNYVQNGWNITGDTYTMDEDGYFIFQARSDDMIVSSGYNIAGPEVEAALLTHPAVAECGVVGAPDPDRGTIVKAYVVLQGNYPADATTVQQLQDHVKATIAPFKYPRAIEFASNLPRTPSGKLQRFALRQMAAGTTP